MLTIQIITKNNQSTIENCLASLKTLKADIRIIDIGSTDDTLSICDRLGYSVSKQELQHDYSRLRNRNLGPTWNMFICPHEQLIGGHDEINRIAAADTEQSFYFQVVQGSVLTKEIRFWNKKLLFQNPVYETIKDDGLDTNCLILSEQTKLDLNHRFELIEKWKKDKPLSPEPHYYQALTALLKGQYKEFEGLAKHYLTLDKTGMAATMLRYYLGMLQAYEFNQLNEAARNMLICLSDRPLMSEFWCLLGDIQYKLKDYRKSIPFYENAMVLGGRRLKSDKWPMDISKYHEHPTKMMNHADKILAETKLYHRLP